MKKLILLFTVLLSYFGLRSQISTLIPDWAFGGEDNKLIVLNAWSNSGSTSISWGGIYINYIFDVNDYGILPDGSDVGNQLQTLINNLNNQYPNVQKLLYFPEGVYNIGKPIILPSYFIIKGFSGDATETHITKFRFFHEETPIPLEGSCITINGTNCGIEDIFLFDDTNPIVWYWTGSQWVIVERYHDMVTFSSSSSNSWMRGVESYKTRRFHVNIYGHGITITGCYFHDAHNYDVGGRAYGVCLSRYSHHCLVENNIFRHLRHSMVFQYDATLNVMAYNYSRDVHAFNNGVDVSDRLPDLCFHGRHHDSLVGPYFNLCEGNIAVRIIFDDEHESNGPYNAMMRNSAELLKIQKIYWSEHQYMQNIIGCNASSNSFTQNKIDEFGYSEYWENDPDWSQIPGDQCSYYLSERPDFFDLNTTWLGWPYTPDEINPAKYRYDRNNGYYQNHPPQTEVIKAGWGSYSNLCGPPKYLLNYYTGLIDQNFEFFAMDNIEVGSFELLSGNSIIFKAENSIKLKPGFKVTNIGNYFNAKVDNYCNDKTNFSDDIKHHHYPSNIFIEPEIIMLDTIDNEFFEGISDNNSKIIGTKINIFPNPNTGIFYISGDIICGDNSSISIYNMQGEKICFSKNLSSNFEIIDLTSYPKGIYTLCHYQNNKYNFYKIIIL